MRWPNTCDPTSTLNKHARYFFLAAYTIPVEQLGRSLDTRAGPRIQCLRLAAPLLSARYRIAARAVPVLFAMPTRSSTSTPKRKASAANGGGQADLPPTPSSVSPSKRRRGIKKSESDDEGAEEPPSTPPPRQRVKKEDPDALPSPEKTPKQKQSTSERKLAAYKTSITASPFPDHPLPTFAEAERVAWILGDFHGYKREEDGGRGLPQYTTPKGENKWGGCGDVASVLDAVIRTVLSCNTSNRNSAAAHKSMTERFGRVNWQAILDAPESDLVDAIRCGGLANNKAKTIRGILTQTQERFGVLSLDHLHESSDDEIMQELVSFNGVGPKVASCVLAFCIGRQSMAVDTHVFRLCKALGWVPEKANRDQTYYHLHERVPGHLKYPLHVLLIKHGKLCPNCSAKGFATAKDDIIRGDEGELEGKPRPCPLKANGLLGRKGKALKDAAEAGTRVKKEEDTEPQVKTEVKEEDVKQEVKEEPTANGTHTNGNDHKAALEAAKGLSSGELLKALQRSRSSRAKNLIRADLKAKHYSLEVVHAAELSADDRKRVFAIFAMNMKAMYEKSSFGWNPADKKKSLFSTESRFALVRAKDGELAGYIMFQFDTEPCHPTDDPVLQSRGRPEGVHEIEVAYIYELQVSKQHQRLGLGHELTDVVAALASATHMPKVMLTVFSANDAARAFYTAQGYQPDPNCPSLQPDASVDYEILYKLAT